MMTQLLRYVEDAWHRVWGGRALTKVSWKSWASSDVVGSAHSGVECMCTPGSEPPACCSRDNTLGLNITPPGMEPPMASVWSSRCRYILLPCDGVLGSEPPAAVGSCRCPIDGCDLKWLGSANELLRPKRARFPSLLPPAARASSIATLACRTNHPLRVSSRTASRVVVGRSQTSVCSGEAVSGTHRQWAARMAMDMHRIHHPVAERRVEAARPHVI